MLQEPLHKGKQVFRFALSVLLLKLVKGWVSVRLTYPLYVRQHGTVKLAFFFRFGRVIFSPAVHVIAYRRSDHTPIAVLVDSADRIGDEPNAFVEHTQEMKH